MKRKEMIISSKIESIPLVESFIEEVFLSFNLSEKFFGNVLISVLEAVNNAICHGNKKNPDKKVRIETYTDNECLIFSISDEGNGFDYKKLPDPTKEENLEKPYGRGIFLIANLTDKYEFQDNGTKIILRFNIASQSNTAVN